MAKTMIPSSSWLWIGLMIAAFPNQAMANAGTPLMWAAMAHLVIGNLWIGIGEGLLLGWLFSVPKQRATGVMIVANYFSAWCGGLFLRGALVQTLPINLNNGWFWFWIMVLVTFAITLILEWPFIAWCLRKEGGFWRSVRAALVTQSISYVLLFGWYWTASGTSLYTKMQVASPAELSLPESVWVYYISAADGDIYKRPLTGGGEQKVHALHSMDINDRLVVRANELPDRWDLMVRLNKKKDPEPVMKDMAVEAAPDWRVLLTPPQFENTWFSFGEIQQLGTSKGSPWTFFAGFWSMEGLKGRNQATGEEIRFSYETPFGAWMVRNAVQLPTDKVLFQLGKDQICVFDPERKKLALLWRGRGPVAVIPKAAGN